ncbi:ABC transporter permease [Planctomycetaceae bacterium SH139]
MTAIELPATSPGNAWLRRLDDVTIRVGDWLNPILVKEARQALKSRQFLITFSLLLVAAWGWTATAILMLMPRIYYVPSGQTLLIGYYLVLAVPMLLVVPLAAHRSLAAEVDDGTLDLLSVTSLSPMQIITGKLASAALQMMLYFVALFPCVAFSYVLRGVDLPSIVGMLGLTIAVGILLTVFGLFLAALPKSRAGQLGMLVGMLIIEMIAQYAVAMLAIEIIQGGFFGEIDVRFIANTVIIIGITATAALVLLRAAAAELSPPSENRSTPIRKALIWHQSAVVSWLIYYLLEPRSSNVGLIIAICYMSAFWTLVGGLMVSESSILTPRVRREMPATFLERAWSTWMTPGPATGLVYAVLSYFTFCVTVLFVTVLAPNNVTNAGGMMVVVPFADPVPLMMTFGGYMMLILTLTRLMMALIRKRTPTQPAVGLAVMVIVGGFLAVTPYSVALWWNEFRGLDWTYWQVTNWAWTIGLLFSGTLPPAASFVVLTIGAITWGLALVTMGQRVLPLRVATPQRVLEEDRPMLLAEADPLGQPDPVAPVDPLGYEEPLPGAVEP